MIGGNGRPRVVPRRLAKERSASGGAEEQSPSARNRVAPVMAAPVPSVTTSGWTAKRWQIQPIRAPTPPQTRL